MPPTPPSGGPPGGRKPPGSRGARAATAPERDPVFRVAANAVRELGADEFIAAYDTRLFEKVLESDRFAEHAPGNSDMMFMALMMPVTNGVIHLASSREQIEKRLQWARRRWKEHPDPHSLLSLLILAHIAHQGWVAHSSGPGSRQWNRVLERVRKLSRDFAEDDPGPGAGID